MTGTVLIVGATGGCGKAAYHHCKALGMTVRALVRSPEKARALLGADVELVVGSLEDYSSLEAAFKGVEHVIVALGAVRGDQNSSSHKVDYLGTLDLIKAAKAAGTVKKYVWVTSGQVTRPTRMVARMLNSIAKMTLGNKYKGEVALRASGIPYVIVRPMGLTNDDTDLKAPIIAQGDPWGMGQISRNTVGLVCAQALLLSPTGASFECTGGDKGSDRGAVNWASVLGSLRPDTSPDLQAIIDSCSYDKHEAAAYWFRFNLKLGGAVLGLGLLASFAWIAGMV